MEILIRVVRYLLPIATAEVWRIARLQLILWVVLMGLALPIPVLSAQYFSKIQGDINEPWSVLWPVVAAYVLMLVVRRLLALSSILSSSISRRAISSFVYLLRSGMHENLDGASYHDPSTVDKVEVVQSSGASALNTLFMSMLEVPMALGSTCTAFVALAIFSLPLAFVVLAQAILETIGNMVELEVIHSAWHNWSSSSTERDDGDISTDSPAPLLEVKSLTFSYPEREDVADVDNQGEKREILQFRDFSFFVNQGELVAFIGENGGGKSTLLALFARLYDPTVGTILVSGRSPEQFTRDEYLERVLLHTQSYPEFHQSVSELAEFMVGRYLPTEDEISQAVKIAGAEFLSGWHDRLKTRLNSRVPGGRTPSGGQRQRIMLALTILRLLVLRRVNPEVAPLLLLDEPTSQMSPEGAMQFFEALRSLGVTVVFTTHDHSLLRYADRTVRVSGCNTHEILFEAGCKTCA